MYLYNCITLLWAELTQLCNQLYKIKQIHIPTPIPPETDMPFSSVKSLSHVQLFATPWTGACQASLFITSSQSLPKLMPIKSVIPSNYLILCRPFLLLSSIFSSIRVFSNESVLRIRWPKYWSFSFSISPSNEYSGLISFRIAWFDLLAVPWIFSRYDPPNHSLHLQVENPHLLLQNIINTLWIHSHTHSGGSVVKNAPANAGDLRDMGHGFEP